MKKIGIQIIDDEQNEVYPNPFPIGSIYITVDPKNPAEIFGGEWEQIKDRFLLGAGEVYENGAVGGSADASVISHTHTTVSSGSHNHGARATMLAYKSDGAAFAKGSYYLYAAQKLGELMYDAGSHTHTVNSSGVSGTGKNMPPYLVVYIWKRVK